MTDPDIVSGVERSIPFRLYLGKIDEVRDKAGVQYLAYSIGSGIS